MSLLPRVRKLRASRLGQGMPERMRLGLGVLVLLLIAACSSPQPPKLPVGPGPGLVSLPAVESRVQAVSVKSTRDMNRSMALMLDIVFVRDRKLVDKLPKTAPEWFLNKPDLRFEYGGYLAVLELQMTLSDETGLQKPPEEVRRAEAVLVYANYLAEAGQQRVDISVYSCPRLLLLKEGLVVTRGPYKTVFGLDPLDWGHHACRS